MLKKSKKFVYLNLKNWYLLFYSPFNKNLLKIKNSFLKKGFNFFSNHFLYNCNNLSYKNTFLFKYPKYLKSEKKYKKEKEKKEKKKTKKQQFLKKREIFLNKLQNKIKYEIIFLKKKKKYNNNTKYFFFLNFYKNLSYQITTSVIKDWKRNLKNKDFDFKSYKFKKKKESKIYYKLRIYKSYWINPKKYNISLKKKNIDFLYKHKTWYHLKNKNIKNLNIASYIWVYFKELNFFSFLFFKCDKNFFILNLLLKKQYLRYNFNLFIYYYFFKKFKITLNTTKNDIKNFILKYKNFNFLNKKFLDKNLKFFKIMKKIKFLLYFKKKKKKKIIKKFIQKIFFFKYKSLKYNYLSIKKKNKNKFKIINITKINNILNFLFIFFRKKNKKFNLKKFKKFFNFFFFKLNFFLKKKKICLLNFNIKFFFFLKKKKKIILKNSLNQNSKLKNYFNNILFNFFHKDIFKYYRTNLNILTITKRPILINRSILKKYILSMFNPYLLKDFTLNLNNVFTTPFKKIFILPFINYNFDKFFFNNLFLKINKPIFLKNYKKSNIFFLKENISKLIPYNFWIFSKTLEFQKWWLKKRPYDLNNVWYTKKKYYDVYKLYEYLLKKNSNLLSINFFLKNYIKNPEFFQNWYFKFFEFIYFNKFQLNNFFEILFFWIKLQYYNNAEFFRQKFSFFKKERFSFILWFIRYSFLIRFKHWLYVYLTFSLKKKKKKNINFFWKNISIIYSLNYKENKWLLKKYHYLEFLLNNNELLDLDKNMYQINKIFSKTIFILIFEFFFFKKFDYFNFFFFYLYNIEYKFLKEFKFIKLNLTNYFNNFLIKMGLNSNINFYSIYNYFIQNFKKGWVEILSEREFRYFKLISSSNSSFKIYQKFKSSYNLALKRYRRLKWFNYYKIVLFNFNIIKIKWLYLFISLYKKKKIFKLLIQFKQHIRNKFRYMHFFFRKFFSFSNFILIFFKKKKQEKAFEKFFNSNLQMSYNKKNNINKYYIIKNLLFKNFLFNNKKLKKKKIN